MDKLALSRASIASGVDGLRITAWSAVPEYLPNACPTWDMVTSYKAQTLSIPDYLRRYRQRLDAMGVEEIEKFYRLVHRRGGELAFLCYCRDGAFCHTYYAIKYLTEHPRWSRGFVVHPGLVEFVEGLDWEGRCWRRLPKVDLQLSERTEKWLASLPPAGPPVKKELDQGILF